MNINELSDEQKSVMLARLMGEGVDCICGKPGCDIGREIDSGRGWFVPDPKNLYSGGHVRNNRTYFKVMYGMRQGMMPFARRSPNYFWYATNGFAVSADEIPPYAGWLRVEYSEGGRYVVTVERPAPRLHTEKMTEQQRLNVTRWLSYKLKNFYVVSFMQKKAS